jgi:hypothetical protein
MHANVRPLASARFLLSQHDRVSAVRAGGDDLETQIVLLVLLLHVRQLIRHHRHPNNRSYI